MLTYVGEVVLGQHGVSGIARVIIMENNVLLALTALNDLVGASLELVADLLDQGDDEGGNDGEDEDGKLLLQLLNDLRQHRDLLNGARDALHDVIMELNGRHDLLEDVLDVEGELLRVTRGDGNILHLSRGGVLLELIDAITLVLVTKDAVGDLVQQVPAHAGIGRGALLKSALEFVNLILGQLVGHLSLVSDVFNKCEGVLGEN